MSAKDLAKYRYEMAVEKLEAAKVYKFVIGFSQNPRSDFLKCHFESQRFLLGEKSPNHKGF